MIIKFSFASGILLLSLFFFNKTRNEALHMIIKAIQNISLCIFRCWFPRLLRVFYPICIYFGSFVRKIMQIIHSGQSLIKMNACYCYPSCRKALINEHMQHEQQAIYLTNLICILPIFFIMKCSSPIIPPLWSISCHSFTAVCLQCVPCSGNDFFPCI